MILFCYAYFKYSFIRPNLYHQLIRIWFLSIPKENLQMVSLAHSLNLFSPLSMPCSLIWFFKDSKKVFWSKLKWILGEKNVSMVFCSNSSNGNNKSKWSALNSSFAVTFKFKGHFFFSWVPRIALSLLFPAILSWSFYWDLTSNFYIFNKNFWTDCNYIIM